MPSLLTSARGELPDHKLIHKLDDVERTVWEFSQRLHENMASHLQSRCPRV